MAKKPKTVQVGSREYFDALLTFYTNRSTAITRGRGNLSREDLEYVAGATMNGLSSRHFWPSALRP